MRWKMPSNSFFSYKEEKIIPWACDCPSLRQSGLALNLSANQSQVLMSRGAPRPIRDQGRPADPSALSASARPGVTSTFSSGAGGHEKRENLILCN